MKKLIFILLIICSCLCGCLTHSQSNSNLFKIPYVPSKTTILHPGKNITISYVNASTTNTTNTANITAKLTNWTKLKLIAGRVGWGVYSIHPLILVTQNNSSRLIFWLNKTVNSTRDVLNIIYHQKWAYLNGTRLFVNNTYFRILRVVILHNNTVRVHNTKWWKIWWDKELKEKLGR